MTKLSRLRGGIDWILAGVSWAVGPVVILLVWTSIRADARFVDALASAVAGAVGMVPQGLVLLTSIAFAVGVIRLGRRNVLVQRTVKGSVFLRDFADVAVKTAKGLNTDS